MNPYSIIDKYYPEENELRHILLCHSRQVADKALAMCNLHPELNMDRAFVEEASLLHDIGIFLTDAPPIFCFGSEHYMRHGILGAELMRQEGFARHALVCERHTGTGLTREQIIAQKLPLPLHDFVPVSLEEQVICFADTFYSKTHLEREKTIEEVKVSAAKYDKEGPMLIDKWCKLFL